MIGPSTDDNPKAIPNIEVKTRRLRRGTSGSMIIIPPEKMPADPRPAMARPIMKGVRLYVAPPFANRSTPLY
jgi:hypothetical protein